MPSPVPDGAAVAEVFALGRVLSPPVFAARGEQGVVYRMVTERGTWAVKRLSVVMEPPALHANLALQEAALRAGVPVPASERTASGEIAVRLPATSGDEMTVRVYEWVDLDAGATVPAVVAATSLGHIHRVGWPALAEPIDWFTQPVPSARWERLHAAATRAAPPWLPAFEAMVGDVMADADLIGTAPHEPLVTCHLDYNPDNVLATARGGHVVIDWDNAGPAARTEELASALAEFGCTDADAARAFRDAYVAAGGSDREVEAGHFSLALAVQAHLLELYARRWLSAPAGSDDRRRCEWRLEALSRELLTRATIERVVCHLR